MLKNNLILTAFLVFFLIFFLSSPAYALVSNFNPNYIISDEEVLDYTSMSLAEIQSFLRRHHSFLADYRCQNPEGKTMTAAEIIYDRAQENHISPRFIIVLLQKEQSLIEDPSPTQRQLDWATGYGCPDGGSCNPRWRGFWKQVNSATLQFKDYMDNPHLYTYQVGQTYTFTNPYGTISRQTVQVTPQNLATAALYNYTPHVYNGNYNFYNIWRRYFTRHYPDGTLLQAKGEVGVWLIQNGKKRPFLSRGALTSRFDPKKIIIVSKSELDNYEKGAPIKFPQYSVVRSPGGTIYLLVDDKKRGFVDGEAFRKIGINPEEIIDASWEDLSYYQEGEPITASSTYPTGALLQDRTTGGVWWVENNTKAALLDAVFLHTKFKGRKIIQATPEELAEYKTIAPVRFGDGELLKAPNSPAVYVIAGGKKRPIISGQIFENLGYKWENIITVPEKILNLYEEGDPIDTALGLEDEEEEETGQNSLDQPDLTSSTSTSASTTPN